MMKVLLVEDDQILQELYRDEFLKQGFEVVMAGTGRAGVIEAAKGVDFILLDIMMPDIDGVTAFKHLKELPETKHIPVGFLTVVPQGVPQALNKDQEIFKEAVAYWSKDKYTPIEIVQMVKTYLTKPIAKVPVD